MTKAKTAKVLRRHVKRRAHERFGLTLTDNDIETVCQQIRAGKAELADRQSTNKTRWIVTVKGQQMAVVYDKQRGMIRTVLPVDFLETTPQERTICDIL